MERRGVTIVDTFAEAFDMRAARVLITAHSARWAHTAAQSMTGFATSVIGCKVEAGVEADVAAGSTPDGRRYWRIPVMEGEFLVQETFGVQRAIGGGNFLILAADAAAALAAAEAAVAVMRRTPGVILPFPGGIVRSGSKVGAKRYKKMIASTNDAYCPTLRGRWGVKSELPDNVNAVLEIVVDGLDRAAIERSMRAGIEAACRPGIVEITAGNYGGKLGKHHFHLHALMATV